MIVRATLVTCLKAKIRDYNIILMVNRVKSLWVKKLAFPSNVVRLDYCFVKLYLHLFDRNSLKHLCL